MKRLLALAILLVSCTGTINHPGPNEKLCRTDWDCREWEYCGFSHIDSYLTCRAGSR